MEYLGSAAISRPAGTGQVAHENGVGTLAALAAFSGLASLGYLGGRSYVQRNWIRKRDIDVLRDKFLSRVRMGAEGLVSPEHASSARPNGEGRDAISNLTNTHAVAQKSSRRPIIIITGANSGLGFETAVYLSKMRTFTLVCACRRYADAVKACASIRETSTLNPQPSTSGIRGSQAINSDVVEDLVIPAECDLSSFQSVEKFADDLKTDRIFNGEISNEQSRGDSRKKDDESVDSTGFILHALVCNAGVFHTENGWVEGCAHESPGEANTSTKQENDVRAEMFEKHLKVNHLGHFHLVSLLKDYILAHSHGSPSAQGMIPAPAKTRLVIVTSSLLQHGRFPSELVERFGSSADEVASNTSKTNTTGENQRESVIADELVRNYACFGQDGLRGEVKPAPENGELMHYVSKHGYADSKLLNALAAVAWGEQFMPADIPCVSVSPGWCYTNLSRHNRTLFDGSLRSYVKRAAFAPIAGLFMRSGEQGSWNILHAILSDDLETGGLYRDGKRQGLLFTPCEMATEGSSCQASGNCVTVRCYKAQMGTAEGSESSSITMFCARTVFHLSERLLRIHKREQSVNVDS